MPELSRRRPHRHPTTTQRLPCTALGLAGDTSDSVQRLTLTVKPYSPVDLLRRHRLVSHLDTVFGQDFQEAALGQLVDLAQRAGRGATSVGIDHFGDRLSRQPTIQPPRSYHAAVWLGDSAGRCSIHLGDNRRQPVRLPLFQIPSANPVWNRGYRTVFEPYDRQAISRSQPSHDIDANDRDWAVDPPWEDGRMVDGFSFPPADNGLDYVHSVVDHLSGTPSARDLKYAVLHLQAAIEVLLKVRLIREHWTLVFKNPDKATLASYIGGDFISIGLEETLARLKGIAGIDLSENTKRSFGRLAKERNKLQHFGLEIQANEAIEKLVGEVFDALLLFITEHLKPDATDHEREVFDYTQTMIEEEIDRINTLVTARLNRLAPELDANAANVVACPSCRKFTLPLVQDELKCLFCDRSWEPEQMASDYASEILGITWRDVAKGADEPVVMCPECCSNTMVWGVTVREESANEQWGCFNCCTIGESELIMSCSRCGLPMAANDEDTVCGDCWTGMINKE